jgi:hypothetical protein
VYSGFEALVFAAVGWLFGREVNRERAEKAEAEADTAREEAGEKTQAAERGIGVANMVLSQAAAAPQRSERLQAMGVGKQAADTAADELAVLQDFVLRQFPDLA